MARRCQRPGVNLLGLARTWRIFSVFYKLDQLVFVPRFVNYHVGFEFRAHLSKLRAPLSCIYSRAPL